MGVGRHQLDAALAANSPPRRLSMSMVYDVARARTVMSGDYEYPSTYYTGYDLSTGSAARGLNPFFPSTGNGFRICLAPTLPIEP